MTRRVHQRIVLSFVCALALILIPLSFSPVWAQSTSPATTQQDKIDRNDVNQNPSNQDQNQTQSNQDLNQSQSDQDLNKSQGNPSSPDADSSSGTRQKPSEQNNPNMPGQTQSQDQNQNRTYNPDQGTAGSQSATETEKADQNAGNKNLPKTAGELPLIALIGLLSLGAAAGTRILARSKSTH